MGQEIRKTGIEVIGELPWGTHLCQFYRTKQDLLDILIPYFKAGLENNEFCLWITSESPGEKEAQQALREAIPEFDQYLKRKQIEIIPHTQWYSGFNLQRVLDAELDKLKQALDQGYEGLRVTGNIAWLEKDDWKNFAEYEQQVNKVIGNYPIIALCTYSLDKCGALDVIDVVSSHQLVLVKREGEWELSESSERKRTEETLRRAEPEKTAILDNMSELIIYQDMEMKILWTNRAAGESVGLAPKQLVGRYCYEIWHQRSKPCVDCPVVKARKTGQPQEMEITTPDGRGWFIRGYPVRDANGEVVGTIQVTLEITKRKRAEESLRESEARYRELADSIADVFFAMDRDLRYTYWNRASENLTGISAKDAIGKSLYKVFPEVKGTKAEKLYLETLRTQQPQHLVNEYRLKDKDFFFEISAYPSERGLSVFVKDITERKRVEEALRESEEKYRNVVERANDGITILQDGIVKYLNLRLAEIWGGTVEEVLGTPFTNYVHPDELPTVVDRYKRRMTGEEVTPIYETVLRRKDGSRVYAELNAGMIIYQGKPADLVFVRDITERKQAEAEIKRRNEELAALNAIAATVSSSLNLQELLERALDKALEVAGMEAGSMYLLDQQAQELILATYRGVSREFADQVRTFKMDESLAGRAAQSGEPVVVDDVTGDPRVTITLVREEGIRSFAAIPMKSKDKVRGVMHVASHRYHSFTSEEVQFYTAVANQIGMAIENARLYEAAQRELAERKRAEEALRESQRLLQKTFASLRDAVFIIDADTVEIINCNPAASEMFGYSRQEMLGRTTAFLHVDEAALKEFREHLYPAVEAKGFLYLPEFRMKRKSGEVFPSEHTVTPLEDEQGKHIGWVSVVRDISERKRAEEALAQEQYLLQALMDNMPDHIYFKDADSRFVRVNKALAKWFGLSDPAQAVGKTDFDFFTEAHAQQAYADEQEMMRTGRPLVGIEEKETWPDGQDTWVSTTKVPLRDKAGHIIGTFGISRDITERKRAEEALHQSEEQLRQSQKMEAVGQLAGGVAHDFNNLLTAITGYTELSLSNLASDHPMRADLEEIRKAAYRAASLTRQLLAFSRRQPLQPKVLNLNDLVANMDKMLRRLIGEDIDLVTVLEPTLGRVKVDPGQIEQVIMNLAVNARDAMSHGGRLTIKTENMTVDRNYCKAFSYARPGKFICLSIQDTGVGMDKATREKMFEPFFSTKGPGEGTGLGLSVVYGIVKQHEGWITVDSEPGQGSTFKVYLPTFSVAPAEESEKTVSFQELQGSGERILLVEDEQVIREFTTRVLRENGYVVFEATTAEEALQVFEREKRDFHLVFSDVVLPDKTGLQLVEQLRSQKSDLRVLLSSGYTDQKSQWPLVQERGFQFLQKPYVLPDLLRAVKKVIRAN